MGFLTNVFGVSAILRQYITYPASFPAPQAFSMSVSVTTAILVGAVVSVVLWNLSPRKSNFPPGPRRWPLIGSVLAFPRAYQWVTFSKWAKTYGNIVYVNALGEPLFIINSAKVAIDLLDKRSSIYSDRPSFPMATLSGNAEVLGIQSYNEKWRQQRKIVAQDFSPSGVPRYYSLQETESRKLVRGLLGDPSTMTSQIQLRVGAIVFRIVYGYFVTDENDPFLTAGLKKMEIFGKCITPGVWAVNFLPICSGFLRTAKEWRKISRDASWDPYLWCKKNLATGTVLLPNLCAQYLAEADETMSEEQEERLVWAADNVLGGALDTASSARNTSSILTFFLAMILNPSVQRKAQEEIDRVIGPDRLPVIQDRASLPYVRGLIAEVFRWHPATPLGLPHKLSQDDIYDGIYFPKGSVMIPNAWHMLHDPEVYPNPMEFNPGRYEGLDSEMNKVTNISFGFGRRVCPGRYLAEGTLFAVASTVLATCEILPVQDSEGNVILPEISYTPESGALA
ncbi:putative monooxygenase [Mycena sanguinolenta]|uniref:Putative monooxygenase n=1 Tax=Mycena sanguinolenta TaxID=230812 RepID=A0A8H6ZAH9_9AGAR|nr:putative monooxygenase [Mycena sanguinolenta]